MKPTQRRILYRRSYGPLKTSAEITFFRGSLRVQVHAPNSPQERRALMLAIFRAAKPWLNGIRRFEVNHLEFGMGDRPYTPEFIARVRNPICVRAHQFGSTVRLMRIHSGWTLYDLSRVTGLSASHLSEIERGLRRVHSSTHLKLERALGTPLPEIPRTRKPEKRLKAKQLRASPRTLAFVSDLRDLVP